MGETNRGDTASMIYWKNNKHYIIEFLYNSILIYNMFEYELYASIEIKEPHKSGYIHNQQYLLAISDNNTVSIWDLINLNLLEEIKHECTQGFDIIPWNNRYTLFSTNSFIYVLNNNDYSLKKIKGKIKGMKKIIINGLGECLIGSEKSGNIQLYKFN